MQILRSEFVGKVVMSVHTGEQICVITDCIIQQNNLRIILFSTRVGLQKKQLFLLPKCIRFADRRRLIVDSNQSLSEFDELVRYQHDILHTYQPLRKKVVTESGKKLGTVSDYSFDNQHNFVQKLYVHANFFKRLLQTQLIIDRSSIIETKTDKIIVKDTVMSEKSTIKTAITAKTNSKVPARSAKNTSG
jgi:uncharacterized protein YrrD